MPAAPQPFFLDAGPARAGQRFCLYHAPAAAAKEAAGAIVYLHPFAEEMNKARRMAALQSRALAQAGFAVLQIDLLGCGDSSGDFGDASWDDWIADALLAAQWLQARHAAAPLWFWGLRAGCLLASAAARQTGAPAHCLFWQPPASGKLLLQQFLRLRVAGQMFEGKAAGGGMDAVRATLAAGQPVEIAGYALAPALAGGLEQAQLLAPAAALGDHWFEISARPDATLLPATQTAATAWRNAGRDVTTAVVTGPAFWQTQEIEDAPALLAATVQALTAGKVPA